MCIIFTKRVHNYLCKNENFFAVNELSIICANRSHNYLSQKGTELFMQMGAQLFKPNRRKIQRFPMALGLEFTCGLGFPVAWASLWVGFPCGLGFPVALVAPCSLGIGSPQFSVYNNVIILLHKMFALIEIRHYV